jgi:hypothetical protein
MTRAVAQQVLCSPCHDWFYREDVPFMTLARPGHATEFICPVCTLEIISSATSYLIMLEEQREPS